MFKLGNLIVFQEININSEFNAGNMFQKVGTGNKRLLEKQPQH